MKKMMKDQFKMQNDGSNFDHQYEAAKGGLNPEKKKP